MRKMLLSFKADVFQKVLSGEKIYEHRRVFPDEPIEAYLYVSAPVKAIVGIMHLEHKTDIESWKEKYKYDEAALYRIDEYLKHHQYAMEIKDFQNTNAISLYKLRDELSRFVVPQMYYFIDDSELLDYLQKNLIPVGDLIQHDFSDIKSNQICKM